MKQIVPFKKIFASTVFFVSIFLSGLFTQANAQTAFPLTVHTDNRTPNTIKVVVTNNKAVSYTTRAVLSDVEVYNAYKAGNDQQYKVITPGNTVTFTFTQVLNQRMYEAAVYTTTEANPTGTTPLLVKKVSVVGNVANISPYQSTTPQSSATSTNTNTTNTNKTTGANDTVPKDAQTTPQACPAAGPGPNSCADGKDNDGDCRIDWNGGYIGGIPVPPDPACINAKATEYADGNCSDGIDNNNDGKIDGADPSCQNGGVIEGSIIPCENKCDLGSVMLFLNNAIKFVFKFVLFPIVIFMFIYAGYSYITAGANAGKKVSVRRMIGHIILGMVIMLCAWLVVTSVLRVLGYKDNLYFFNVSE